MCAEVRKRTALALGGASRADVAPELHDAVAKITALRRLDQLVHDTPHLGGILERLGVHTKATANTDAMGIGNNAALMVKIAQEQVGYLTPHAGKS